MDFRRLRSFVQIAEHGSISRAAAAAGLAQPALSQQLAALEQDLRVKLVERSTTGVRLTPEGEVLYGRAQIILRQVEEVRADLRSPTHRLSGPVAIGLPPSLSESLTVPLLLAMCRDHPDLRPQVVEEGSPFLEELLAKGGL
jgi:LysR family nitrogen assimilation transcriptional regulator